MAGGGVAANGPLRERIGALPVEVAIPPIELCTDNAAMIAWAGALRFAEGLVDPLDAPARARWPLDPEAERARGAGVKA